MENVLCYESIEIGYKIPMLIKRPVTTQIIKWVCLTQRFYEIHYDKDFAVSLGFKDVLVHGETVASFLSQMLTDWIGDYGAIRKLSFSFRGPVYPGEDVICRGLVSEKFIQDEEHYLKCEMWAENPKGEKQVVGEAAIILYA